MTKKIADISKWQGVIDWPKAAGELALCILRASCCLTADIKFADNAKGCNENGIPFHAYHYLMAMDEAQAKAEAEFFYKTASVQKPLFYVVDVEDEHIPTDKARSIVSAFLARIKELGARRTGIYVAHHCYKAFDLATEEADYVWIPRYGKNTGEPQTPPAFPCDLWQYTSKGALAGVKGDVDLNTLNGSKTLEYFTASLAMPEYTEGVVSDMNPKFTGTPTNMQLAAWMYAIYAAKVVYWYGTCFYKCTGTLYTQKKKQYPKHYTSSRKSGYMADIAAGRMCADCVGAIKGFFWTGGDMNAKNVYQSNNCPDRSADGLFSLCDEKGPISTIPDIPGLVVHAPGHIGVYVGGGKTIELSGFAADCTLREVSEGSWKEWGKLPASMIRYVDSEYQAPVYKLGERELIKGDESDDVAELQRMLVELGYNLGKYGPNEDGVDGEFGKKTYEAVKNIQACAGLSETGVYDVQTHKALLEILNPPMPDVENELPEGGGKPAYVLIIEGDEEELRAIQTDHGGTLAAVDSVVVR